jgi:nitrate reductase delta subunit
MNTRHPRPTRPEHNLRAAWQSAAIMLAYPDDQTSDDLRAVRAMCRRLPDDLATPLVRLADYLDDVPLEVSQPAYVETFDNRRQCSPYLTYFAHGDTRKRGVALLRFKQTYLRSGYVLDAQPDSGAELPDHLTVVLEYAATVDPVLGWRLLLDHRAGLEVLRLALQEHRSPWADALVAVCRTLPPLRGDEREAIRRLAAEGPPAEEVGLSPYGVPDFDALLHEAGR